MNPNDDKKLETLIHRTLRSLPERQAPRTLEHRVLNAIAARHALPWWRQSFSHWPIAARAGFAGGSLALIAGLLLYGSLGADKVGSLFASICACFTPVRTIAGALASFGHVGETLFHSIPNVYLYGGFAAMVMAYAALIGLGTTAYRTFIANR